MPREGHGHIHWLADHRLRMAIHSEDEETGVKVSIPMLERGKISYDQLLICFQCSIDWIQGRIIKT